MLVKLQRPPPEMRIFLAQPSCVLDDGNTTAAFAGLNRAHQTRRAAGRESKRRMNASQGDHHVEQAEPWQVVFFQQSLVDVLLLQLIDLRRWHFAAIRGKVAVSLGANHYHLFVLRSGE